VWEREGVWEGEGSVGEGGWERVREGDLPVRRESGREQVQGRVVPERQPQGFNTGGHTTGEAARAKPRGSEARTLPACREGGSGREEGKGRGRGEGGRAAAEEGD